MSEDRREPVRAASGRSLLKCPVVVARDISVSTGLGLIAKTFTGLGRSQVFTKKNVPSGLGVIQSHDVA